MSQAEFEGVHGQPDGGHVAGRGHVPADYSMGELGARPGGLRAGAEAAPGLHSMWSADGRETLLFVPNTYTPEKPARLVVLLHGAGGDARHGIPLLEFLAAANRLLLLAPSSRSHSWDVLVRDYGPDVSLIDSALQEVFDRYAVDPSHLAIGGFSDGASYALSLGIANGDLFTHVIAFSPGFMAPTRRQGKPRIFISHGTHDAVLPIDHCSRRIVPQLRRAGYGLTYVEFEGPRTVPSEIKQEAVAWFNT